MAKQALVRYQVVIAGDQMVAEEKIEGKVTLTEHGPASDLIEIAGKAKTVYVHRANLVSIVIDKTA